MKTNKKKKLPAKKVSKKSIAHKNPQSNSMALATISYNDIVAPVLNDNALSLVKTHFSEKVIKFITRETPIQYIQKRPGPGGKQFDYVSGWYAKKCANYAFGFSYSFEIKSREISGLSAIVEGRFIVNDPKTGREIFHKDDIGGHQIKFLKDKAHTPENAVDIANDYKSAATDSLKRCMAQIGFFNDVYGPNEARDDGNYANGRPEEPVNPKNPYNVTVVKPPTKSVIEAKVMSKKEEIVIEYECESCNNPLTKAEADYSKKIFKRHLCRSCQKAKR